MKRKESYLHERIYSEGMRTQGNEIELDKYWMTLLGQEVFNKLRKNCKNFVFYLNQNPYEISIEKGTKDFVEFLAKYKNVESTYRKQNVGGKIYFEGFYKRLCKYGEIKLIDKIGKKFFEEKFWVEFESQLCESLQEILLRTLIVQMHDYEDKGCLEGENANDKYNYFCEEVILTKEFLEKLFEEYPVLYRCIEESIRKFVDYYAEVVMHVQKNKTEIEQILCDGQGFHKIQKIIGKFSDTHNNGRQVVRVYLDNGYEVLYKPRSMENEEIYANLLQWLAKETKISQYKYPFLTYSDHSWSTIVKHNFCNSKVELKNYYLRLGVQLFLIYLLGTKDIHAENLIASGEYPVLIDLETLTNINYNRKRQTIKEEIYYQLSQSVLCTGLLPFHSWNYEGNGINCSGISGKEGQRYPFKVPVVVNGETTDMRIEYANPLSTKKKNLATVKGVFYEPVLFSAEIIEGFQKAYNVVLHNKEEFSKLLGKIENARSRYLVADTQRYGMLLSSSYHPNLLRNGAMREIFLYSMWNGRKESEKDIVESEVSELLNGDIPYFYHYMNSKNILNVYGKEIKNYFNEMPIKILYQKLEKLSIKDKKKQCEYIEWVLKTTSDEEIQYVNAIYEVKAMNKQEKEEKISIKKYIELLTERLLEHAVWNESHTEVSWNTFKMSAYGGKTWDVKPMNMYMYDGLAGMLLLLYGLKKTSQRQDISEMYILVKNMLFNYTVQCSNDGEMTRNNFVGAYDGESSIIYTYLILFQFGENEYLAYAQKHAEIVEKLIDCDKKYDLIAGNAGAAQVMLMLYKISKDRKYLEIAERAISKLEEGAEKQKKGLGWNVEKNIEPMAGMAHGNSGILIPVIQLWVLTKKEKYRYLAEAILEYEESLYNPQLNNWDDMRAKGKRQDNIGAMAWCHGAPGILLSRVLCYEMVDDPKWKKRFKEEILKAYSQVEKYFLRDSWCICHGNSGNLWILNRASEFLGINCMKYTECLANKKIELLQQEKLNPGLFSGYGGMLYYLIHSGDISKLLEF